MTSRTPTAAWLAWLLLLGTGASCGSSESPTRMEGSTVQVGTASLEVPRDWQPTLTAAGNRQVWVPADNQRKESISVRVIDRRGDIGTVDDVLDSVLDADGALPDVRLGQQRHLTTAEGMPALWVDLTFTPGSVDSTYARTQLTVVTPTHIIHVLYTALTPDVAHRAIDLALNTIHEES